jgi:hypothetical protein
MGGCDDVYLVAVAAHYDTGTGFRCRGGDDDLDYARFDFRTLRTARRGKGREKPEQQEKNAKPPRSHHCRNSFKSLYAASVVGKSQIAKPNNCIHRG